MQKLPSAVWVVDTNKEHPAVARGQEAGHPGRRDPRHQLRPRRIVDYPIPGNDDAIRSVHLLTRVLADAVADGLRLRAERTGGGDSASTAAQEPLAEWEQELEVAEAVDAEAPAQPQA
jgi:small subunit ribosomal protein S2